MDGRSVHLLHCGPADNTPPVLLLHGAGIDRASLSWGALLGPLSTRRRVIAPDWPGYGGSTAGDFHPTVAGHALWAERLLDTLGVAEADIAGISLGGGAALWLGLTRPSRVRDLVLVDPYGLAERVPLQRLAVVLSRLSAACLTGLVMGRSKWFTRQVMLSLFADPARLTDDIVAQAREIARTTEAMRSFERFQRAEVHWRRLETVLLDRVEAVRKRTLLVHGRHDGLVPLSVVAAAADRMVDARMSVLDAGHWPPREVPEVLNPAVIDFLTSRGADSGPCAMGPTAAPAGRSEGGHRKA